MKSPQWAQEKQDKDLELGELVADLDRVTAEKDQAIAELTEQLATASASLEAAEGQAVQAIESERAARSATDELKVELSAAQSKATTLQQAHDALLQRINPPEEIQKG